MLIQQDALWDTGFGSAGSQNRSLSYFVSSSYEAFEFAACNIWPQPHARGFSKSVPG